MSARLPEFVDPWLLADRGATVAGEYDLSGLKRLTELLQESEGVVSFELIFSRDAKNRARITGFVRSELALECQRCLEMMQMPVDAKLDLVVIQVSAEAEIIPDESEPVLVEDGLLKIIDLVEDELLLAIPLIPMHGRELCSVHPSASGEHSHTQADASEDPAEVSPFAILSSLKADKSS